MTPNVAVIILNWNGWKDTIECLESLYQINYPNFEVIVIDNHSQDESIQKIRDYCNGRLEVQSEFLQYQADNKPIKIVEITNKLNKNLKKSLKEQKVGNINSKRLILIKNDNNYGFAEGNNIGIRFALKNLESSYILLLNNDTVMDPEFLGEMVKTAESDKQIGFVGSKTYFYDKINTLQAVGGGNIDFKLAESPEIGFNQEDDGRYDQLYELDYVGGACILTKTNVINEIGILDTNYYMYWEDVDWCFNGREAGYKSVYAFKSKIWHKYGTSSKGYFKTYYHNRNRLYFMRKHANKKVYHSFLYHYLKEILIESAYQLIYCRDWLMFKSLFRGTIEGLRIKI
jgi:GT2 family glycosyltransferase